MSFLAPPDAVMDWRRVLLTNLAEDAGLLDRLPGTAAELVGQLSLDPMSTRVVLEALTAWKILEHADGRFAEGPAFPADGDRLHIRQHARVLARWTTRLPDRLGDPIERHREPRCAKQAAEWLAGLATRARNQAPAVIDACLDAVPGAKTVFDIGGGHGEYAIEAARRGLEVTLIDLPDVIESVREWPRVRDSGIDLVAGDVFDDQVCGRFDLVLCFSFTHAQPLQRIETLFRILAAHTADGGGIAIHTYIRGTSPAASLLAVQTLAAGRNGDTHTLEQYVGSLVEAGFEPPRLVEHGDRTLMLANLKSKQSSTARWF